MLGGKIRDKMGKTFSLAAKQFTANSCRAGRPRKAFMIILVLSLSSTLILMRMNYKAFVAQENDSGMPIKASHVVFPQRDPNPSVISANARIKKMFRLKREEEAVYDKLGRIHSNIQGTMRKSTLRTGAQNASHANSNQNNRAPVKKGYAQANKSQQRKENLDSGTMDKILFWDDDAISDVTPHWQRLDNNSDVFVYSAHYDDIQIPPVIRAVGLAKTPLQYKEVWCRFHDHHGGATAGHVLGKLYHFRWRNCTCYLGAFADCPLASGTSPPYAITLVKEKNSTVSTFFKVHKSLHLKTENHKEDNSQAKEGYSNHTETASKWRITRCFPAFQKRYNEYIRVAEMVAASRAVGVDHFVFYVESVGKELKKLLQALKADGLAEVYPWNLHLSANEVHYLAQFSAIQDCLYRHLHSSRYLLFGDVDELFVPRSRDHLLPLLDEHFTKSPFCGAFLFRNTFFDLSFPTKYPSMTDPQSASFLHGHRMPILQHPTRQQDILRAGDRSQPAVDPRKVSVGSVHIVEKFRKGFHSCAFDPKDGLLHHYRYAGNIPESNRTEDALLWRFADVIIKETRRILEKATVAD